jgi:saccharopine dehydrogenase-like NADP-dependent oxidoreductase
MTLVVIIGGTGRVGTCIAQDLLTYTSTDITLTGRNVQIGEAATALLGKQTRFQQLDLSQPESIQQSIRGANVVIDTAGPFHPRNLVVLEACIAQKINYLDVSDDRSFTQRALGLNTAAEAAGITAVINTGVFPGISNSMVRQGVEHLDTARSIHLSYVVAGSGGAGVTVMRTTFIGLQRPFAAWLEGRWQQVQPYTGREVVEFPLPYGPSAVYWYDMPEALTLVETFPVQSITTKFGIVPSFYNTLTGIVARRFPAGVLRNASVVELLARISHKMTNFTDRYSGTGVAIHATVKGEYQGQPASYRSTFSHESAARATGYGTGSIAQLLLSGQLKQPGVRPVEQVLSTQLFEQVMQERQLKTEGYLVQES